MTNYNEMKGNAMSNKTYRLLKDLPFAKAGEIFKSKILDDGEEYLFWGEIKTEKIENFDEWFEEIYENVFYFIDVLSPDKPIQMRNIDNSSDWFIERLKSLGNYFDTEEEAEKHLEWLKARTVLIRDTKGFKPDWNDNDQVKFSIYYDFYHRELLDARVWMVKRAEIFFETEKEAENSIKIHEKWWKIYLGVEE